MGELCSINSGRDYKHLDEGGIPVFGTGGFMTSVNEALSYDRDAVGIGRKGTIDKPYKLRAPFWTVDTLFYCIPEESVDLDFLEGLFLNVDWASKDESTGLPSLSKTIISDVEVLVPKLSEQVAISGTLASLDNLITLHQRKCERMKHLKAAMLDKMFPRPGEKDPELRFEGFTEAWERHKLVDILEEYLDMSEKGKGFEHVSLTKDGVVPKSDRYNRDSLVTHDNKQYRVTHLDDICYNPANLKFGVICRNTYSTGIFSPIYVTFRINPGYDPAFVERLVRRDRFISAALRNQEGTVYERMSVKPADLLNEDVSVPNQTEQRLIGQTFDNLDSLINLHQRKHDQLETLKKSLLEKMFV